VFERLKDGVDLSRRILVYLDGREVEAREGDTVASVLLVYGDRPYRRTPLSHSPRAPFCMMGVCFECLVQIDGTYNQQGCLVAVEPGMRIERQMGLRTVERA
jgi:predicted molibdopterin-dependent oxidoreductase YjgC